MCCWPLLVYGIGSVIAFFVIAIYRGTKNVEEHDPDGATIAFPLAMLWPFLVVGIGIVVTFNIVRKAAKWTLDF